MAAPAEREKTAESDSAEAGNKDLPHTEPQEPEPESEPGRWFHVSDTHVAEVVLDKVLKVQAHLLFYERIIQVAAVVSGTVFSCGVAASCRELLFFVIYYCANGSVIALTNKFSFFLKK